MPISFINNIGNIFRKKETPFFPILSATSFSSSSLNRMISSKMLLLPLYIEITLVYTLYIELPKVWAVPLGYHSPCRRGFLISHQSQIRAYGNGIWKKKKSQWNQKESQKCSEIECPCDNSQSMCLVHTCTHMSWMCWGWLFLWMKSSDLQANSSAFHWEREIFLLCEMCFTSHVTSQFLLELQISFRVPSWELFLSPAPATVRGPVPLGVPSEHSFHCSPSYLLRDHQEFTTLLLFKMFVHTPCSRFALHFWRQRITRKRHVHEAIPNPA